MSKAASKKEEASESREPRMSNVVFTLGKHTHQLLEVNGKLCITAYQLSKAVGMRPRDIRNTLLGALRDKSESMCGLAQVCTVLVPSSVDVLRQVMSTQALAKIDMEVLVSLSGVEYFMQRVAQGRATLLGDFCEAWVRARRKASKSASKKAPKALPSNSQNTQTAKASTEEPKKAPERQAGKAKAAPQKAQQAKASRPLPPEPGQDERPTPPPIGEKAGEIHYIGSARGYEEAETGPINEPAAEVSAPKDLFADLDRVLEVCDKAKKTCVNEGLAALFQEVAINRLMVQSVSAIKAPLEPSGRVLGLSEDFSGLEAAAPAPSTPGGDYASRRSWADKFNNQIKAIIGQVFVRAAPGWQDRREATDFILHGEKTFGARVRSAGFEQKYPFNLTLRTSGRYSEHSKILNGNGPDFIIYAHEDANNEGKISRWVIVKTRALSLVLRRRREIGRGMKCGEEFSRAGREGFYWVDLGTCLDENVVVACSHPEELKAAREKFRSSLRRKSA